MNKDLLDEIIGWYGMTAILLAYALVSFNFLSTSNLIFQLLNLTGAGGVAFISFKKNAYQPGLLNIAWAIIAMLAIIRLLQ